MCLVFYQKDISCFFLLMYFQAVQDLLVAQKTGLDYLQRLILKSRKDFSSNAMLFISEKVGLPHLANPPPGMMVPCIPKSYVDKCSTNLAAISTFSPEAQASLFSKVSSTLASRSCSSFF